MDNWDDEQGVRAEPLVVSIILIVMSCILTQVALTLDNWASMDAEIVVSSEDRAEAEEFGFELPEFSMTVSFGLDEMITKMNFDDGEDGGMPTVTLEELAMADSSETNDDMDFAKWYTAGKTTSIALWVGFSIGIIGAILALLSAFKGRDSVQSGAIVLCGISAAMLTAGWINWIAFGGSFGGESSADDLLTSDGFGPSFGFLVAIFAGIVMTPVPFILAWSQQLPIDKLLPLKGGFESLEMRELTPTGKLNATIAATLACALLLSVAGQGVGATFLTPDATISPFQEDGNDDQVKIPWISIGAEPEVDWNGPIEGTISDGDSVSFLFFEGGEEQVPSWQRFKIEIVCEDGGNGETGAPNAQEETDILHWTISANNGQELTGSLDCDGSNNVLLMFNEGNDDFDNWFDEDSNCPKLIFHYEGDADSCVETAPLNKNMFPISVEFTAETDGDTMEQNQDKELEFYSETDGDSRYCPETCHANKKTWQVEYVTWMATEDSHEHEHYNGTS